MNFKITTSISKDYQAVFAGFDQKLFEFLLPPKAMARLVQFDGSKKGDIVHIQFLLPYKAEWISEITHDESNDSMCMFIDEGKKLPFGLKTWQHRHIVKKDGNNCLIIDDISFSYANKFLDILFFPFLYFSFLPRKKQYRQYFV